MGKRRGGGILDEFSSVPELYAPFMTISFIAMIVAVGLVIAMFSMTSLTSSKRTQMGNALIAMGVIGILALFGALLTGGRYYGT